MSLHRGFTVWFTGLPCSGKSTLAEALADALRGQGRRVEVLDGDVIRTNLCKGLGFSREDRNENIRRVGFVSHLLSRNGVIAIAALISPYRDIRDEVRRTIDRFVEVYVKCPLEVCMERDVKGMYRQALSGERKSFTGVSAPYEEPLEPEIVVETDRASLAECVSQIIAALHGLEYVSTNGRHSAEGAAVGEG